MDDRKHWPTLRFDQIAHNITERVDPAEAETDIYVGLEHLDPESLHIKRWGTPADVKGTKLRFYKGDIIFGRRRAYQRKLAVAEFDGICSAHAMVLRANEKNVLPEFLPFFMQSDTFFERALQISVGSLSPTINWKTMARQEFTIPPLDEQRRIAEILWVADSELQAHLKVMEKLEQLKYSVTKKIFEDKNLAKTKLGDLISQKVLTLKTGPFGTVLKASSYVSQGTPIINPVNMLDGKLDTSEGPFLSDEDCERLSTYKMVEGDIVLGRKGDVGRGIYVTKEYDGYITGSDCIRLRLNGDVLRGKYLHYYITSPNARLWISRYASGTTMPGINERILALMSIVVPGLEKQDKTIETFETIDKTFDNIQTKIQTSKQLQQKLVNELVGT